jgi:oxygen-independent coproporphyrinogen III oxidase
MDLSESDSMQLGIYIHVPYCRTICPYCDFVKKRVPGAAPSAFVDAVCAEIEAYAGPRHAASIFFGGGTPSLVGAGDLARILAGLAAKFTLTNPEITLEANPDDVTESLAAAWLGAGINRVSLGVQSFDESCLRYLGRRHDQDGARRACRIIGACFGNWSLDLIFGARPVGAWQSTLEEALTFGPPHMSAYGLTYEPGTAFEKRAAEAVDDEVSLGMYHAARTTLADYEHYEVSNFARPGFQCRHNLVYWHNGPYAGFGPGAYSYVHGVRARNHPDVDAYLQWPGRKQEALRLSAFEERVETVIQYLRLREGVSTQAYRSRFGRELADDFAPQLNQLVARGLLEQTGDGAWYRPTALGYDLNNEIGLALVS